MSNKNYLVLSQQSPDSPELEFLLHGCTDDNERNVVRYAFHAFARGDPGGFSIQFAVLLQAHARALKSVPERLRKVVAMELATMSDSLVAHRSSLKEAESAIAKDAREIREGVVSLTEEIREIRTLINQMRETEIPAREMFLYTDRRGKEGNPRRRRIDPGHQRQTDSHGNRGGIRDGPRQLSGHSGAS